MGFILNLLIFVFSFGILVTVHEVGHFIMAKRAGIYCYEFAIGMGPKLFSIQGKETKYSIRAFPIGGYVAMAGEETNVESSDIPASRRYDGASAGNRFLVAVAGVMMNFFLAFFLFLIVALSTGTVVNKSIIGNAVEGSNAQALGISHGDTITKIGNINVSSWDDIGNAMRDTSNVGKRDLVYTIIKSGTSNAIEVKANPRISIDSIGIADYSLSEWEKNADALNSTSYADPIIGVVQKRERPDQAFAKGLLVGDRVHEITDMNGTYKIDTWHDLAVYFSKNTEGLTATVKVKRIVSGEIKDFSTTVIPYKAQTLSDLGGASVVSMSFGISPMTEVTFLGTFKAAGERFANASTVIFKTLVMVFGPSKEVGVNDLGGILSMFSMTGQAASLGIISLFAFMGLLSVNLGIMNLLPIPALDGSRILFIGIEVITGKKVNPKIENTIHMVGMILLYSLMLYILFVDINRFFG